jgi:hypothetical protein
MILSRGRPGGYLRPQAPRAELKIREHSALVLASEDGHRVPADREATCQECEFARTSAARGVLHRAVRRFGGTSRMRSSMRMLAAGPRAAQTTPQSLRSCLSAHSGGPATAVVASRLFPASGPLGKT